MRTNNQAVCVSWVNHTIAPRDAVVRDSNQKQIKTPNNYQVTRSTGSVRKQQMPQGCCRSLLFSHSAGSDSLQPHRLQLSRLPCPSPSSRAWSNSCALSPWWHPTISSSVVPFSSRLQSFPAPGFFQWVSSSHRVAKELEFQLQRQSFQWIFRTWTVWKGKKESYQAMP